MEFLALYKENRELFNELRCLTSQQYANKIVGKSIRDILAEIRRLEVIGYNVFTKEGNLIACFSGDECSDNYKRYHEQDYILKKYRVQKKRLQQFKDFENAWEEAYDYHSTAINIFREYSLIEEINNPFEQFIAKKIGAIAHKKTRRVNDPSWHAERGYYSPQGFELILENGNRVFLDAGLEGSVVYVPQIIVKISGTGLGTKTMEAIKEYVDMYGSGISVYKVCNHKYFGKISWLTKDKWNDYKYEVSDEIHQARRLKKAV